MITDNDALAVNRKIQEDGRRADAYDGLIAEIDRLKKENVNLQAENTRLIKEGLK